MTTACIHNKLICLNQYELIRKYKCSDCSEIMMCACDKEYGERFLPHQLYEGCWLDNQERVPVTLGFQEGICPECRGEPAVPAPKASRPGATSKVARYYWREITFESTRRFYDRYSGLNPTNFPHLFSFPEENKKIRKEVIAEIKEQHAISPKYTYNETPQSEVLEATKTETTLVRANHVRTEERKVKIELENRLYSVEEFASKYFEDQGYSVLETESIPFHVIFGTFMWDLIQDSSDPKNRVSSFGNRTDFNNNTELKRITNTLLPSDFGKSGYFSRRQSEVEAYVNSLNDLKELFEEWLLPSTGLRDYLWAHREKDILTARKIVEILGDRNIKVVLLYLVRDYWKNFCGWPDLLVYDDNSFFFVEVKSSNDKLSEDQKNWLRGNKEKMGFKVKIFKVGKL